MLKLNTEATMRERAGVSCDEGEEKKKIRHRDVVDSLTMVSLGLSPYCFVRSVLVSGRPLT